MKIEFPEEYIRHGEFELHSGENSDVFYDINEMLTNDFYVRRIVAEIPDYNHYVGIATGGAIIAGMVWIDRPMSRFSMVKDGELKGEFPPENYILIDDVVTTEKSLKESIRIIGKKPSEIWVAVDRRDLQGIEKTLEINSFFEI